MKRLALLMLSGSAILMAICSVANAQSTVQVLDTLYNANGTKAGGRLVISWDPFTAASGETINGGTLTYAIPATGADAGVVNLSLAPNAGATPAGTSYRAQYFLVNGASYFESWVVPATGPVTIGAIRTLPAPTPVDVDISSLNGLTAAVQTFTHPDDTNVTLGITSSGSNHAFTMGWTGLLALGRGGTNQSSWMGSRCVRVNDAGTALESAPADCGTGGGSITTREVDGAPSIAGTGVLEFDQADGFVLTNPSGTIARLDLTDAPDAAISDAITLTNITQITNRAIGDTTGDLAASRVADDGAAATQALFSGGAGAAAFRAIADGDIPAAIARDSELHAQSHVIADATGLGADHTTSGLTAGQVLRASGATTAAFAAIQDADVPATITRDAEVNVQGTANEITSSGSGVAPTLSLAAALDLSGKSVEIPNSISLPGTCAVGQIYHDTDAALGARFFLCTAVNTWTATDNPFGTAIDDGELAANYSGVGACGANSWASTLNDNAAPTCTQPGFSNLSGTAGDAQVDGSLEADELVLAGDVDGTANANDLDEAAVEAELEAVLDLADLQNKACADLSDESALCASSDIDSVTGQANWGAAATKETADLTFSGVEADFDAGAANAWPRLLSEATPTGTDCDAAGEAGRLLFDPDLDTDGSVMVCRGTLGWKDIDDDGGAGGFVSFDIDGDNNSPQTITDGNEALFVGGAGIITTAAATDQITIDFGYTDTLAGNPALAVSTVVFSDDCAGGGWLTEGNTANTNEMLFCLPSLDEVDTTHVFVAESTTQTLTNKTLTAAANAIEADTGDSADAFFGGVGSLDIAEGGTNATTSQGAINNLSQLTTNGDLLYHNGTNSTRIARGTDGQCLTSNTTTIVWGSCSGAGGGDNVSVNSTAVIDIDLDDADPAAPSDGINVRWQLNATPSPDSVSANVPTTSGGSAGTAAFNVGTASSVARSDHEHRTFTQLSWFFPGAPSTGVQTATGTLPDGIGSPDITDIRVTVNTTSASSSTFNMQRCTASCTGTSPTFADIYSTDLTLSANTRTVAKGSAPNQNVSGLAGGDQFKVDVTTLGSGAQDITVTMTYRMKNTN